MPSAWTAQGLPVPTMKHGIKIYPRVYSFLLRANRNKLIEALNHEHQTLNTKHEFLEKWKPTIQLQEVHHQKNYLLHLVNISSKQTRKHYCNTLSNLQKDNAVHLRSLWITWEMEPRTVETYSLETHQYDLETLLLGTEPHRRQYQNEIAHRFEQDQKKTILPHTPRKRKRTTTTNTTKRPNSTPADHQQNVLEQALQDAMEIDWTLPIEERAVKADHLPTQLKGLPAEKRKRTKGDWVRARRSTNGDGRSLLHLHHQRKTVPGGQPRTPNFTVTGKMH